MSIHPILPCALGRSQNRAPITRKEMKINSLFDKLHHDALELEDESDSDIEDGVSMYQDFNDTESESDSEDYDSSDRSVGPGERCRCYGCERRKCKQCHERIKAFEHLAASCLIVKKTPISRLVATRSLIRRAKKIWSGDVVPWHVFDLENRISQELCARNSVNTSTKLDLGSLKLWGFVFFEAVFLGPPRVAVTLCCKAAWHASSEKSGSPVPVRIEHPNGLLTNLPTGGWQRMLFPDSDTKVNDLWLTFRWTKRLPRRQLPPTRLPKPVDTGVAKIDRTRSRCNSIFDSAGLRCFIEANERACTLCRVQGLDRTFDEKPVKRKRPPPLTDGSPPLDSGKAESY